MARIAAEGLALAAETPPAGRDVLDGVPDWPVALVTFGTVFTRTPGAFELVLDAVADLDVTVVATTGAPRDPAGLDPVPDNVRCGSDEGPRGSRFPGAGPGLPVRAPRAPDDGRAVAHAVEVADARA